jgi:hypothetical protein
LRMNFFLQSLPPVFTLSLKFSCLINKYNFNKFLILLAIPIPLLGKERNGEVSMAFA